MFHRSKSCIPATRNLLTLLLVLGCFFGPSAQGQARKVIDFDPNWRFVSSDTPSAQNPIFDDSKWQRVDVPHDWPIAGPIAQSNLSGQGGGFFPTGVGWYRKSFTLDRVDAVRHVYIVFDGVMANSDVWINGFHLGHRPNGSVSFYYELTTHLHFDPKQPNILAVRCDTTQQPASRWYEGNGIYRKVRLVLLNEIHMAPWSTVVTTPRVTREFAAVQVDSLVANDSNQPVTVSLNAELELPSGKMLVTGTPITSKAVTIAAHSSSTLHAAISVPHPELWDVDHPAMHRVHLSIHASQKAAIDEDIIPFGIREFHFDADTGFWLNGHNFKIKGVALHIDAGAVGIAVPTALYEQRLLALRALGINAIRTAHNPPSPDFLDLCDRLGFLVMDELFDQWTVGKNPYDYHLYFQQWAMIDVRDTVLRDRNHPSIIVWSAGNEIHDTGNAERAKAILSALVKDFHENDPTRPVTQALFRPNVTHDYDDGLADMLDVVGQNYRVQELLAAHSQKPTRKILGTENTHDREQMLAMRDNPAYSGQFLWTGVDYLGEAGELGGWPLFCNGDGLLDRTLVPRARAFERQAWWSTVPNIHIVRRIGANDKVATDPGYESLPKSRQVLFADWSPAERNDHTESVEVYTNADEAEVLLNGKSLGKQALHSDGSPLIWKVPFEAGTLTAIAYTAGKEVARNDLQTAGPAAAIRLTPDHVTITTSRDDILILRAEIVDANGIVVPNAANQLHFDIKGAQIRAVDSGSNTDHDPFLSDSRHAYQGRAAVLIQSTQPGPISVTVTANGLRPATVTAQSEPAKEIDSTRSF